MNKILLLITILCLVFVSKAEAALIAYWDFDEGTGTTANDSSSNGYDGTVYGATWTTGQVGGALSFDGVDDYVEVGDVPGLDISSAITLEAWAKTDKITNDTIISKDDDAGNREYYFGVSYDGNNPGRVRWALNTSGFHFIDSSTIVNDSQWHYIVGTYDGSYLRLYIDGVEDGSSPIAKSGFIPNTNAPFIIGKKPNVGYEQYFRGALDKVAVYDMALTAEEISNRFTSVIPEPSSMFLLGFGLLGLLKKKKKI
ncbi:LamG domain-containing protein [Candidatus Omnitrophota bacterium]